MSLLCVSAAYYMADNDAPNAMITIGGLAVYLAFFSFGMGPIAWLIPSEVFATCIRAKAMSLATLLNRAVGTAFSASFLTLQSKLSWAGFFLMLAVLCVMTLTFVYCLLPETKGRSLEDMSLYFAEMTGDFSILNAERTIRVEQELQEVNVVDKAKKHLDGEGGTMT